jgi:hypothetical protein
LAGQGARRRAERTAARFKLQKFGRGSPDYRTWFRGDQTNFNPTVAALYDQAAVEEYVLKGWLPEGRPIRGDTRITAFGSCFAENIADYLTRRNFHVLNNKEGGGRAYVVSMREGMVNSFVIRQQFEWAWENRVFEQELWHGYDARAWGYDEDVRLETKALFDQTDIFFPDLRAVRGLV